MGELLNKYIKGDRSIWIAIIVLMGVSILAVYSSATVLAYQRMGGNVAAVMMKHVVLLVMALATIIFISNQKPENIIKFSLLAYIAGIGVLFVALAAGTTVNGSARWIYIGGFSIQASEIAKIGLVMFLAQQLGEHYKNDSNDKEPNDAYWPCILATLAVCGLVVIENLSTSLLIMATALSMMFIGNISKRRLLLTCLAMVGVMVVAIIFADYTKIIFPRFETWNARVERFFDGEDEIGVDQKDYQAEQALTAVSTGGLLGKGPGNSYIKNFLPMAFSDFIFSIILEEYGMLGCVVILLCYTTIIRRAASVTKQCKKASHAYVMLGLAIMITLQATINMCVGVGLIPVTGQTLPMVSMGGSSNILTGVAFGIILSVTEAAKAPAEATAGERIEVVEIEGS